MLQRSAGDNPELLRFVTKSQLPGVGGSYSLVGCVPGVDRWFHHYPGPNAFFDSQSVPFAELDKTRLLHFGYPPLMDRMWQDNGDELAKMFAQARKHEIITSLDMAYPHPSSAAAKADWPTIYKNTLPYVSIFLPSLEELIMTLNVALHATGLGSILSQLSTILLAYGVPIVVIKCGDKGLYLRTSNDSQTLADAGLAEIIDLEKWTAVEMFQPCFQVEVAGTTGAGDTTIAGFLASITTGQEPEKTCQMAAATGACCVEHLNATDGIKPYTEIEARVLAGWETADLLTPLGPDWETDTGSISLGPNHVAH
ncbi:MAG: PfkB family carbohydrate kinase [Candidatus Buchananbacteria bacterium]